MSENTIKRQCAECKQFLSVVDFYKCTRRKDGLRGKCKTCWNAQSTDHYNVNKDDWRSTYYKRKYNISLIDYEDMLVKQNGVCAVCGGVETNSRLNHFCVDHNHDTGEVRALLCSQCNLLLGKFENNLDLFDKFIEYLSIYSRKEND